jgi:hypothetical protein
MQDAGKLLNLRIELVQLWMGCLYLLQCAVLLVA